MKKFELKFDRVLIVAELSANHGGSITRAKETIAAAAVAGVDSIKIQTYTPDTITINCDRKEFLIRGGLWDGRTLHDLYSDAHTPWDWHADLKKCANDHGLPLFSTPFDRTAVDFLEDLGVPAHKIASFEIIDLELVAAVAATKKPVIMSTGMASLREIDEAVSVIRGVWGTEDYGLALLRCVSSYPANPADMNLSTINHLGKSFGVIPGLSDHTLGTAVAVGAVSLGARVVEKHFTLKRADGGPDSAFSLEPSELKKLVEDVRQVEAAIGQIRYGPTVNEGPNIVFRRSIFVVQDVKQGERLTRENTRVIRPGHGMEPRMLEFVLGRRTREDILRGSPLTMDLID